MHWRWKEQRFGVWGVRDYYTLLEQMAREGAAFTLGYVMMILAAGLLATAGLLLDNPAVIIGAMCVAPFLSPSRSVCVGGLFRDRKVFVGGLLKQVLGLLVVGTAAAYVITMVLRDSVPGVEITQEILLRAMPTPRDVVLTVIVAIGAGAAASLALTADPRIVAKPWGQIIDAMIGVEIAISLLPPASVIGIGLAFGRLDISRNAFWLLVVNVIGLDFIGSMLMLAIQGVRPRYLASEKRIREVAREVLSGQLAPPPVAIVVHVGCSVIQWPTSGRSCFTKRTRRSRIHWPRTLLPRLQWKQATAARWWLNSSLARRVPRCGQRTLHLSERSLEASPEQPGTYISELHRLDPQSSRACGFGR